MDFFSFLGIENSPPQIIRVTIRYASSLACASHLRNNIPKYEPFFPWKPTRVMAIIF